MAKSLTKTADTILQILNTYGCLTLAQAAELCGNEERAQKDLSHLILINCAKEHGGVYVPIHNPQPDYETVDALWVAIDKSRDSDGNIDPEILTSSFSNKPVQICLIQKSKFYNIAVITDSNISSTLPFIMEKFANNYPDITKARGIEYIFVVRSMSLIKEIAQFAPQLPNRIALIDGDVLSKVSIRYLSQKKG